jgi:hypothetical protein
VGGARRTGEEEVVREIINGGRESFCLSSVRMGDETADEMDNDERTEDFLLFVMTQGPKSERRPKARDLRECHLFQS